MKSTDRLRQLTLLLAALAGSCAWAADAARPHLHLTSELSPPATMFEGARVTGFAVEKLRIVMERAGISYDFEVLPWRRAYLMARTQPDTCVFSTTRVAAREQLFKWVGPTHASDWTLFGRAGRDYRIKTLDDARGLRIGAYNGDVRGEYLQEHGFNVDLVPDNLLNPRRLLLDRIDLWATGGFTGMVTIEQNGWKGKIVPVLTYRHTEMYLACNGQVPDELIGRMNAALLAINREGLSAAIEKRFEFLPGR